MVVGYSSATMEEPVPASESEISIEDPRITAVDLFSGCGGMSLGFNNAGFRIIRAFDNWIPAIENYRANFDHPIEKRDLGDWKSVAADVKRLAPTVILGGPPCQDFSLAGSRSEGAKALLTPAFANIVIDSETPFFVMENVPAALRSQAYATAKENLVDAGYALHELRLNSVDFAVPQKRRRVFVVGSCAGQLHTLENFLDHEKSDQQVSVREALGKIEFDHYYRHPRSYSRRGVFSVDEPSPTLRGTSRPRPATYKAHPDDSSADADIQSLNESQRALLQGFPATYKWTGTKTDLSQMIGNAVPVGLAQAVATALRKSIMDGVRLEPGTVVKPSDAGDAPITSVRTAAQTIRHDVICRTR